MEVLFEILFWWVIAPICELVLEALIARPVEIFLRKIFPRKFFFQESDSFFLFFIKVIALAIVIFIPIIITLFLANKI